jgi:hypothetical protein
MRRIEKVTPEKVARVKDLLKQGISQRDAALRLDVSQYTVFHISKGRYDSYKEPLVKKKKEMFEHHPFYSHY